MPGDDSCHKYPYLIPQLFIEGLESSDYLVLRNGVAQRSRGCPEGERCFGKAIYGVELESIVDLVAKKSRRSFIVVLPREYRRGLLVEAGSPVEPIPLEGMRVVLEVCEGSRVGVQSTLGFIATRKLEVRRIRSHVKGVVVYIYSSPEAGPDKNIVLVAPEEVVKEIDVQS
ncbi:hypothetical protein CF15_00730 [Pyrodictium occultum]|uniref:DUF2118 domain-containing protein n=1 Tax=Pyrodictium occultum TaxID=2309 RepID=A0A0V8RTM4_PYROC|nr:DUF2118 domain-containing protein [Pyrodictium occultum]KSW11417.1 hypothetical protein CF15_00730 [Pyrodictium occultum]